MNSNLHKAKKAKNDEFYTQLSDIEKELVHYRDHFEGKTIYLNCDNYKESNFFKFFSLNFEFLGLKKLISTYYTPEGNSICAIYNGDKNGNRMPDDDEIDVTYLEGDGDFRSEESIALLKEADMVVTNPPFSLFREYVAQLMEYNKEFLIVGNINAIAYKEVFKYIKDNKLWVGHTNPKEFIQPDKSIKKFGNINWFTNLITPKFEEEIFLYKKYYGHEQDYPKYDNYDAIEVSKVKNIPVDYFDTMGVPITFLGKYNPKQFEIRGSHRWFYDKELGNTNGKLLINGKEIYHRFFIKRIKPEAGV